MSIAVGIDFGTSNSAAALPPSTPNGLARVLAIDSLGEDARLFRSVLFFPEERTEVLAGGAAIAAYLNDDAGRFLQSMKSFLPSTTFSKTQLRGRSFSLEALLAIILGTMRERIEQEAGETISHLLLGRPAVFSEDQERDALAETRLRAAAVLAGLPEPHFLIEPIAAALGYEETLERDETVLVGDFGAGTSDFTLMKLGPTRRAGLDRKADVLGSSGVRVGGDNFDAAIVEHSLLSLFGLGTTYVALTRAVPFPSWLPRKLLSWHEIPLLRERTTLDFLRRASKTSSDRLAVERLIRLVDHNLGFHLYRAVEAAKRELSTHERTSLRFATSGIELEASLTRTDFESWTAPLLAQLMLAVDRVIVPGSGVTPDTIFLTGGTSKIPSIRSAFAKRFGESRLREGDAFTSVVSGLGRAAGALLR